MNKILISLSIIGVVAALAVGGTIAFFTDTEVSTGNVFTAGAIDLKVDSQTHYNNAICVNGHWELENGATATVPQYPVIGEDCGGTWGQTAGLDIVNEKFFEFGDIKPGDSGENTISLHVINNDAWVCAEVSNLVSADNSITEPEGSVDPDQLTSGELEDAMIWTIWRDDGDNIQETNEPTLVSGHPVNGVLAVYDSTTGAPLTGNSTTYLGVKWELPIGTGNEVQTDSLTGDISFKVEQARNNGNFRCVPPETITVTSNTMNFGPTGWAGWSCPSTHPNIVGGTTNCSLSLSNSLAWQSGASVGSYTYPTTPFGYTYGSGEEGWIVQNGGTGQSCNIILQCQAN